MKKKIVKRKKVTKHRGGRAPSGKSKDSKVKKIMKLSKSGKFKKKEKKSGFLFWRK